MAEHWCKEHNTVFFKKGKMRNYAHTIGDTSEWCNEPEEQELANQEASSAEVANSSPTNGEMTNDMWAEKQRIERASIERQVSAKIAFEFTEFDVPKTLEKAEEIYQWISRHKPAPEATKSTTEASSSETKPVTLQMLIDKAKETDHTPNMVKTIMAIEFNAGASKNLSQEQRKTLFDLLEEGKYKTDSEDIEPEDIPF